MKKIKKQIIFLIFIIIIIACNKTLAITENNELLSNDTQELTYKKQDNGEILVSGFKIDETISDVAKRRFADGYIIKVKNNEGKDITNEQNTKIGTGNKIELYKEETKTLERTYIAIIYGDTNGDGNVNALDALIIVKNKLETSFFKNKYVEEAGRTTSNTRGSNEIPKSIDALHIVKYKLLPEENPINQEIKNNYKETITITFNTNGGTVKQTNKKIIKDFQYGKLPIPTKEGYGFKGWYTAETGGTKIEETTIANTAEDKTIYAQWTQNQYTITVQHYLENSNDNNYTLSKTTTDTVTYGAQITLENYKTTIENGTYNKGTLSNNETAITTTTIAGDTTIKLYYKRNTYTLTLNKGSYIETVTGAGKYKVGQNVQINATISESETGYNNSWLNWTSGNHQLLADISIQNTTITMPAGDITLTANGTRTIAKYVITYEANGGTGAPESQIKLHGQDITLTASIPTKIDVDTGKHYYFLGWSSDPNSSYGEMTFEENSICQQNYNMTLYAIWDNEPGRISQKNYLYLQSGSWVFLKYHFNDDWESFDGTVGAYPTPIGKRFETVRYGQFSSGRLYVCCFVVFFGHL